MKDLFQIYQENLITEHFVNVWDKDNMHKYADDVWTILQRSYEYCGGLLNIQNVEQLIDETSFWKLSRKGGKIVACIVYNEKRGGRKMCYLGSDGTEDGRIALKNIMKEDSLLSDRKAWGEFSGKAASSMLSQGSVPIPAEVAQEVMKDKKFIEIKPDGYFYTRIIGGEPHTKIMLGNLKGRVEVPEILRQKLKTLAVKYDTEK